MADLIGRLDMHDDELRELKTTVFGEPKRKQPGLVDAVQTIAADVADVKTDVERTRDEFRDAFQGLKFLLAVIAASVVSILFTLILVGVILIR